MYDFDDDNSFKEYIILKRGNIKLVLTLNKSYFKFKLTFKRAV